jgi:two-component system alkaline phosphatase synthesis response regulator PhoP
MLNILVVETDKNLCAAIVTILELAGHLAVCANDGSTAIELAQEMRPSLILCDSMLPHQDGYAVLRSVRQTEPLGTIPIVLMTVYLSPEDLARGTTLGASGYLIKPFTDAELLRKVETAAT